MKTIRRLLRETRRGRMWVTPIELPFMWETAVHARRSMSLVALSLCLECFVALTSTVRAAAPHDAATGECSAATLEQGQPKANNGKFVGVFAEKHVITGGLTCFAGASE
jgi:hypothetical protein